MVVTIHMIVMTGNQNMTVKMIVRMMIMISDNIRQAVAHRIR